tara:strand:- start:2654 stop:4537 length:1884 start_codon:yes stop_codon:yes gene_type:complete
LLQNIRDKSTGWIAYVIVIGISIPFALWGIDQYFTGGNLIAAEVNETKISVERLNNEYQDRLREMNDIVSADPNESELQKKIIKRTVLDELIDSVLVKDFVNKNNFQVSEDALISDIKNTKIFHTEKKFNPERYQKLLESKGIKISEYEKIRKSELKTLQFYNNIVSSSFLSSQQLLDLEKLKYEKRNFRLLSLSYKDFVDDKNKSTEQEKKDFYIKYKNIFSMPEKLDIEFIVFNKEILLDQIDISSNNLKNFYNENKFKYIVPEKRKVSQIFLSNKKASKDKNLILINKIYSDLKNNVSFNILATKHSNDKLSNKKEGDIGWLQRNDLSKELSDAIFTLNNINDYSEIISTDQGYYIFMLDNIIEAKVKDYNDVRKIVEEDYKNIQITSKYDVILEEVSNILFEYPDSLNRAEEFLSINKKNTGLMTLSKIKKKFKILNNEEVLKVIASESVYNESRNSQPIELDENIIILRIKEKSQVEYKKYENVKKEIESLINTENSILSMKDTIKDIENKLINGADIKEIEQLTDKKATYYPSISRSESNMPPAILSKLFSLTNKENVASIESGTGNYELIILDSIEEGSSDLSEKSLKSMINNDHANSILYAVIQSLRENADIKIHTKNL